MTVGARDEAAQDPPTSRTARGTSSGRSPALLYRAAAAAQRLRGSAMPERQRRLAGRHALVDGIPFTLPVNSARTPALLAAFPCDAAAVAALLPGEEVHPLVLPDGRGVFVVTVVNYVDTDIGSYIEYSIAVACTHGKRRAPPLLPVLAPGRFGTGQFVIDLPVSTEISVKGGKGIWGMPKHRASLDFVVTDGSLSSQYDMDGSLVMRIDLVRPPGMDSGGHTVPLDIAGVNYCAFRGMLFRSFVSFTGDADVAVGRRAQARVTLGEHPMADRLRSLGIGPRPLFTAYLADSRGVLDDHFEAWFLTYRETPTRQPEGLESVVGLGLGEDWPPAPSRHGGSVRSAT